MITQVLVLLGQLGFVFGVYKLSYAMTLVGRLVFGLGAESLGVAAAAIEANWFRGKELSFAMTLEVSVSNIGAFSNNAAEPAIYESTNSLPYTFGIGFIVCIAAFIFTLIVLHFETKREAVSDQNPISTNSINLFNEVYNFPAAFWLLCFTIVAGTVPPMLFTQIASEFFQFNYNFGTQTTGSVIGIQSLTLACSAPFLGLFIDKYNNRIFLGKLHSNISLAIIGSVIYLLSFVYIYYLGSTLLEAIISVMIMGFCDGVLLAALWPAAS